MIGPARILLAGVLFFACTTTPAATRTWTGNSVNIPNVPHDNFWTNPFNWSGNVAPVAGDDLVFNGGPPSINTFMGEPTFNSITINGHLIAAGREIALNSGISGAGAQIILNSIKLNQEQTFASAAANLTLVINTPIDTNSLQLHLDGPGNSVLAGVISGSGRVTKTGSGVATLTAANTYTGITRADEGVLQILGSQPNSRVDVFATLGGTGTVGSVLLRGSSATLAPGVGNGTGILTVNGSGGVRFPFSSGTLAVDLNGTTAGTGYDQLKVVGSNIADVDIDDLNSLAVTLGSGFTPAPGASFTIIDNDGADAVQGSFDGLPEGASFTVPNSSGGNTTFFITYHGGDGNDVVLHVPATGTWDGGGGNDKWSTAANWVGDVVPSVGDDLVFPAGAAQFANTNDLAAGTLFNSLTFSGPNYFLLGNAIALRAGIVNNAPSGFAVVQFASILLDADQSFTQNTLRALSVQSPVATNGKRLTVLNTTPGAPLVVFSERISGTGGVTVGPTAACRLDGGPSNADPGLNTYTGTTILSGGLLIVRALQPSSAVEMTAGTLTGQAEFGAITASSGTIRPHDGVPLTIKVAGNLSMSSGVTFFPEISRSNPIDVGRLEVTGEVQLGGATLNFQDRTASNVVKVGDKFVIIANDGVDPVNGTFNGLPEGAQLDTQGRTYSISYQGGDGNDVALQLTALAPVGIGLIKFTNGTDNDSPPGPAVPVGSTVTFHYLVTNTGAVPLQFVSVRDDNGTPDAPGDDFSASFSGGDTNANGLLDPSETFTFTASRIATEGQHTNIGEARGLAQNSGSPVTARNPDNHFGGTPPTSSLGNISTRLRVLGGDNALIGGVIATGTTDKKVIIRAIGPTLTDFGLAGALEDPTLELFEGNLPIASNDDWVSSSQMTEISNTGLAPGQNAESAIIAKLAPNQNYTAVVRGKNGQTGVGLVEVFDLDLSAPARLANISTRGFVDVDDNVMIAGLIVAPSGSSNIKVLVRALGPTLGDFGVSGFLADPTLDLVSSNGAVIRSNNDWKSSQRAEIEGAQLAPGHDEEAALIQSLSPGAYTAIVRGNGGTTGVGLVEVYNIP